MNAAPTAGATIGGGDGTDVIGLAKADFATVAAFSAANLAKITGFEGVKFTNALANTESYDVSKFTSAASVEVAAGVTSGTATVTNLAAASKVTISGANTAVVESAVVDFASGTTHAQNSTVILGGLTLTVNNAGGLTGAQIAAAFANLANGATGTNSAGNYTFTGTLTGWSTGAVANTDQVTFTSTDTRKTVK